MINTTELNTLKDLVSKYDFIYNKITYFENLIYKYKIEIDESIKRISELDIDKNNLLSDLENTRSLEINFIADLKIKYGEELITPTFIKNILENEQNIQLV